MTSLLKKASAWQAVDVTRTGVMSVPVCWKAGRDVCVQDVVRKVAGLAVCVKATERGGCMRTCVLWSAVAVEGVCDADVPWCGLLRA